MFKLGDYSEYRKAAVRFAAPFASKIFFLPLFFTPKEPPRPLWDEGVRLDKILLWGIIKTEKEGGKYLWYIV